MTSYTLGAVASPIDVRNYKAVCGVSNEEFPTEFELPYLPQIKNQYTTFSCVAHALSSIAEYFNYIQEHTKVRFSTEWFYGNRRGMNYRGTGMITSFAMRNFVKYGAVFESSLQGNNEVPTAIENFEAVALDLVPDAFSNRILRYFMLDGENSIKSSLMQYGPVVIVVNWRKGTTIKDGILRLHPETPVDGGHCMYIYGWDELGWKVANSWGTSWGNKGKCIIPYDEIIREYYGVEDTIISETVRKEKMEELKTKINTLIKENEELHEKINTQMNEILTLSNEISDLSIQIFQLQTANTNLVDDKEKLNKAINEIQLQINKNLDKIEELKNELDSSKNEVKIKDSLIEEYQNTINLLKKELLDIKTPFHSKFMQIIAKVLNWILNIFNKKEE